MSNNEFAITEQMADAVNSHLKIATGPVRLLMIRSGLASEIRIPGFRLTGKAPKCSTILRREFGLKGKPVKLLAQFEVLLQMVGVIKPWDVNTVTEDGKVRILTRDEAAQIKAAEGKVVLLPESDTSVN